MIFQTGGPESVNTLIRYILLGLVLVCGLRPGRPIRW